MTLTAGTRLGAYEITGLLGTGGMGEVYRARDARLGRDVAIKVLPPHLAGDRERLARLQQEARTLASLNHPHIAHIYGLEESSGVTALVMELVEGEDLAARLARTRLALSDVLSFSRQIADALENAHARGIVHRDLKPANVQITSGGTVKVLDFGLAKAIETDARRDTSDSVTVSAPHATHASVIVGTPSYMSPEQATGAPVDRRTDIWSFGCVVFEMLTGARAFAGRDVSDTFAAVFSRDPDFARLPAATPEPLRRLLRRCLARDQKERLHDIADARLELVEAAAPPLPGTSSPGRRLARREAAAWSAVGLLAVILIATVARGWRDRSGVLNEGAYRASVTLVPPLVGPATTGHFALSHDGRRVAFVGRDQQGTRRVWVQELDATAAVALPGTDDAAMPFWAPDGSAIGFFAHEKLKKVAIAGGPPVTIADSRGLLSGGSWTPGGVVLFSRTQSGLQAVPASGGAVTTATMLDAARGEAHHVFPHALPDGRHFLYHASGSKTGGPFAANGIYAGTLGSSERRLLVEGGSNAQYASGYLLFVRQQTLMAQPFDAESLALTGEAKPVAEGIGLTGNLNGGAFSVAGNGVLAYRQALPSPPSRLVWFDRGGSEVKTLGDPAHYRQPEMSPDGTRVAVAILDGRTATRDLWIVDVGRDVRTRLTDSEVEERFPVWSPDGSRIAFTSGTGGAFDVVVRAANGIGGETVLVRDSANKYPTSWSSDGKYLLYYTGGTTPETGNDLLALPVSDPPRPFAYLQTAFSEIEGRFSPDGTWVAYQSSESGVMEVYVSSFPKPATKFRVSTKGGRSPRWNPARHELLYLAPDDTLMAVAFTGAISSANAQAPRPLFKRRLAHPSWTIAPDGKGFLLNVADSDPLPPPLMLFINWTRALSPARGDR